MSHQDLRKKAAAEAALEFVEDDMIVGVGTGSTVNFFIDGLAQIKDRIQGAFAVARDLAGHARAATPNSARICPTWFVVHTAARVMNTD